MATDQSIYSRGRTAGILPANVPRCAAAATLSLLAAVALTIVARRAAGALEDPLPPMALATTGLLVAAAAAAIRLGWPSARRGMVDWIVMVATSLAVVALGASLRLPGTPAAGMFLLCMPLLAEESWAWAWHNRQCFDSLPNDRPTIRIDAPHGATPHALLLDRETADLAEEVTQQLTRRQTADGADELSGWLRMPFAAGQRTGSIHLAFCPPMAATPELAVEQIDGPEARIKVGQLLPYGSRLDLKLAAAAEEPTAVLVQFSARTPGRRT